MTCDAWDFDRRLEEARAARDDEARRVALSAAAALAGQPFLDGLYGDWADEAQARMRDRVEQLMIRCGEAEKAAGAFDAALACFRRAAELDAFREKTRVAIVECLVRTGARRAARVEYESLVALLKKELDVEPLPETAADVRRLLGTPALPGGEDDEDPMAPDDEEPQELAAIGQAGLKRGSR
jgi:DNA-binding SARP family transcriptional activator